MFKRIIIIILAILITRYIISLINLKDKNYLENNYQPPAQHDENKDLKNVLQTLPKSTVSKSQIQNLLKNKNYSELNTLLDKVQNDYTEDFHKEYLVYYSYDSFAANFPQFEALLNDWVKKFPDNYQPYLARANYYQKMGWNSRGKKFISETKSEELKGMEEYFNKAKEDIQKSLSLKQGLLPAYYILIGMDMALGDKTEKLEKFEEGIKANPYSFILRASFIESLLPRWGGSYKEVDEFAEDAQKYSDKNPLLKSLRGYSYFDAGHSEISNQNYKKAIEMYTKALSFGINKLFLKQRANAYFYSEELNPALNDINKAIEISDSDEESFSIRASIYCEMNDFKNAIQDIKIAESTKPNDEDINETKKYLSDKIRYEGSQSYKAGKYQEAIEKYSLVIDNLKSGEELFYWRGRAFMSNGDMSSAESDLKNAIKYQPDKFEIYDSLGWVLSKSNSLDEGINYWSKYIKIKPNDDKAYLRRAQMLYHNKNIEAAKTDLKKSSDLGNEEAKQKYEQIFGQ